MNLVLDIGASVVFWRQLYPRDRKPKGAASATPDNCAYRKRDISVLAPTWVDETFLEPTGGIFHVLLLGGNRSRHLNSISLHSWNGPVPPGSFFKTTSGVFVESPAFMYLHAATVLDRPQLIAFGDELCGLYSFDQRSERGFTKRIIPLVSKSELESYLRKADGCKGRQAALTALPHVVERSASPMETFDEMTMCLPYRYGGYGIPQPSMNCRVDLSGKAARIAKRQKCYLDMGYLEQQLDIEHHGKHDHSSEEDKADDRARVNGLKEQGFEVVELTIAQVEDLHAYEYIIQRIASRLGTRLRKRVLGPAPERLALRKAVFAWNASSGRVRLLR